MAALFAFGGLGLLILGLYGYRLMREPGVETSAFSAYVGPEDKPQRTSLVGKFLNFMDRAIGGRVLGQMSTESRRKVRAAIARAGSPDGFTVETLIQRQATWAALGVILGAALVYRGYPFGLAMPVLGWYFPRFALYTAAQRRSAAVERELPDFLDVLSVTISAGLGFRSALRRVATLVGGPVSEEMLIALRQIDVGASRRSAFEEMRERSNSPSLNNFVTSFLQAEELGTPITGFLESYAKELRRTAGQRARTAAARANPKISLILTLVIMPALTLFMIGSIILMAFLGQ
ncbi:type II secretion system F family protein [Nocardioides speluncae]|uniref:type II secretion system F family protein n=1 Tax=Nocardioides speluncae TaxID=2670337 RepID=UPI000D68F6F0|nr:type II secretion system F family protein [Nocardioides speluncae]